MTPPAAAAAARTRTRTTRTSPPPRRVSGPARGKQRTTVRSGGAAAIAAPPPLALRLGGAVHGIAEHHLLERIIRGRAWIGILAVGLIGIVFMQVSMLRMNAGIGQAVERSSVLERQNAAIRASISELSSGDRIAAEAARMGLILPAGTPRFLDARGADARRALASMTAPGEGIVPTANDAAAAAAAAAAANSTTPTLGQSSVAATSVPATGTPETGTASTAPTTGTTATTTGTTTAAPPTSTAPPAAEPATVPPQPAATGQPATTQSTSAPPSTASSGGMDASGQVG